MSSTNGFSGCLPIKKKGDMALGWVLKVEGGQEVGKGRRKNRYDQSSLGTRMNSQ